ncbi:MAG TPA: CoA-binding protein, partial [Deltaproteobacteria bacterium]|nr:CoA-binding protein [Deltaproteobacteria bacterium]
MDIQCELPDSNPLDDEIRELLQKSKKIAIVGISRKEDRDSFKVAKYLKEHGYQIIPVNPVYEEVLGEKCYKSLSDIPFEVDIVD